MATDRTVARIALTMVLGAGAVAAAVAAAQGEVYNPWGGSPNTQTNTPSNGSSAANTRPPAAGNRVALRPIPDAHAGWVFREVINPWADTQPNRSITDAERALIVRARARASRLAACFPATHDVHRYWAWMTFGQTADVQGNHPAIDRCVARVVSNLGRQGEYTLALGFDREGLREVFVIETRRAPR